MKNCKKKYSSYLVVTRGPKEEPNKFNLYKKWKELAKI